ncbi:Ser/Thr protein kinase RdoA (MazF antagonist) [Paenibacillus taihuensis]|uniref:Ser/Thr protein kinase RdoA (MazF antagonist) n=1 Tax=Paenibacillus taihuensis TaxID=1156355 RepID=A0A3D9Q8Z1_9BACL|nr:hypothetical protein [Paenibacillus taihuensis]REE57458.1 Ser/Thr protein kinase RdoA (MazF antagonist) [Paenibacillus taihuensis]
MEENAVPITAEIASGHPTGGDSIPLDDTLTKDSVRSALMNLWGINEELTSLAAGTTSQVWQTKEAIVKLARDDSDHFNAGLRAGLAVEARGIPSGSAVINRTGELSVKLTIGTEVWMLAVLRQVGGSRASMHDFEAFELGEMLANIHIGLGEADTAGAWTAEDVLGHMERGIMPEQPETTRRMIISAIGDVREWYSGPDRPMQMIRGDGPEILVKDGAIAGIIDWGGVRCGTVADDIGCWTLHGSTKDIKEYTRDFIRGYTKASTLSLQEEQAIPLFQRLRLASRACYVTVPASLRSIERWMTNIQS